MLQFIHRPRILDNVIYQFAISVGNSIDVHIVDIQMVIAVVPVPGANASDIVL